MRAGGKRQLGQRGKAEARYHLPARWPRSRNGKILPFDRKPENQQNSRMKTTFDLPPELVKEVKLRAVHEGRKLKDVAAELLRRGLASDMAARSQAAVTRAEIKLPFFPSPQNAPASRMTTEEILALEQEALYQEDLQRVGITL